MSKYYSIKEIAEKLNVPEYTIRYWMRTLGISGRKRHNRVYFDEKGVGYFIGIKSYIDEGYNLSSVKSLIKDEGRAVLLKRAGKALSREIVEDLKEAIKDIKNLKALIKEIKNVS